jgi:hypothetical protein
MANAMANAQQADAKSHDFAISPVPSPSKNLSLSEGKEEEAARARPSEINAVVADLGKSLKAETQPFTPGRVFQLAVLNGEAIRPRPQPQDPIRTPEEQKAWLAAEIARERGAA